MAASTATMRGTADRTEPARLRASAHIPALDGVRGIAVLLVMLLHFTLIAPHNALESFVVSTLSVGWAGVDLFFVLSGFLITGILYDAKGGDYYFRNFYIRRTLRIFPLYYGYLVLVLVLLPFLAPGSMERLEGAPWLWTYMGNFFFARVGWEGMPEHTIHLWSLAVEEQFYLLWPVVVFLFDRARLIRVASAVIALAILCRIALLFTNPDGIAGYALLPARMDALALGGLLALLVRGDNGMARAPILARRMLVAALALLAGAVVWGALAAEDTGLLAPLSAHTQVLGYLGNELAGGTLILTAVTAAHGSAAQKLLTTPLLVQFGKYSYGLYLIHVPVRDLLRSWLGTTATVPLLFGSQLPAQLAITVGAIAISAVLALVSWHIYEKHFLKLKALFPYGAAAQAKPQMQRSQAG